MRPMKIRNVFAGLARNCAVDLHLRSLVGRLLARAECSDTSLFALRRESAAAWMNDLGASVLEWIADRSQVPDEECLVDRALHVARVLPVSAAQVYRWLTLGLTEEQITGAFRAGLRPDEIDGVLGYGHAPTRKGGANPHGVN